MKLIKTFAILALIIGFLLNTTSCVAIPRKVSGTPKGWHKNSNNPHHLNSTNPGKSKSK